MFLATDKSESLFADLICPDGFLAPFVDRYSQFGLAFPQGEPMGPGRLEVRSTYPIPPFIERLMQCWVQPEGSSFATPVRRLSLRSLPWGIEERGDVGSSEEAISLRARYVYLDERQLLAEFTLANEGERWWSGSLSWEGVLSPDREGEVSSLHRFGITDPSKRMPFAHLSDGMLELGLQQREGGPVLPVPAVRVNALQNGLHVAASASLVDVRSGGATGSGSVSTDQPLHFAWSTRGCLSLDPGATRTYRFLIQYAVKTYRLSDYEWPDFLGADSYDMDTCIDEAKEDYLRRVDVSNVPESSGDANLESHLWRARQSLLHTGFKGTGKAGEFKGAIASCCTPSSSGFTKIFFWDSLFTSVALKEFEPEFARGAIQAVFTRQSSDGHCPEHNFHYHVDGADCIGSPQAPVASWAVEQYLMKHGDDTRFLEAVLPNLKSNLRFWREKNDRDRDGLAEWTWSGQTADDSPMFDEFSLKSGATNLGWVPPLASVQLNSFLYKDALTLARLARMSGEEEYARDCEHYAEGLSEGLFEICFVPEEKRFWDYNHTTGRHTRIKTFYMFWPIWAGMPVPEDTKRDLIENVLLSPKHFFGDIPFPSVAYSEGSYDPRGYWRGRTWPHISYWLIEMLWREGYREQADAAAERILSAFLAESSFPENLASKSGLVESAGHAHYNWGMASAYLLGTKHYQREQAIDT